MHPSNWKAHRQRGRAFGRLQQPAEAVAEYSMALVLLRDDDPARPDLLGRRAGNYLALGEDDKALADVRTAGELDAVRGPALRALLAGTAMSRARDAEQAGDHAAALRCWRTAAGLDPDDALAHNNLAWQLLTGPKEFRDPKEALRHARRAVEVGGAAVYLNTLGVALYRTGAYGEAVTVLDRSLAAGKGEWDGFDPFFLARCHARLGDDGKGKDCFARAVKWVEARKDLAPQHTGELRAFRAEAEEVLRGK